MNEQKIIKKQLIKNMILNFVAFTIIFSILGLIIYWQVSSYLYQSADIELRDDRNIRGIIRNYNTSDKQFQRDGRNVLNDNVSPRIMYFIRDEEGNILDDGRLNEINSYDDVFFDKNSIEKIYPVKVLENYQYRAINYKVDNNGETIYIQILINVDAENMIISNFTRVLILCIIIMIIISIIASYFLSKYTLKPILNSWQKQNEFVQNASHELRTPLTIIKTKLELLLEQPESKIIDKAEDINISLNETRRLTKLVKDLMLLARADSNQEVIEKEEVDLDKWISKTIEPYIEISNMQGKNMVLKLNYGKTIKIDINKIHQLFIIVLDNAIKYTEKNDNITVSTYEKDNKCVIEIIDTGIGISDESIEHIFERFYREDKARSRESGGSGLGLSIADYIVNLHGGTIKAEHNNTKGTKIIIKLPKG